MTNLLKMIKENWLFLSIIIVVILLCPFLINFIVTTESPLGFINSTNREAWISFFGSIIGGAMTLIGVWWTIVDQDKKRKEDQEKRDREKKEELAIQYRPLLKSTLTINDRYYNPNIEGKCLLGFLPIKNIGRGEANSIHISVISKSVSFLQSDQKKSTQKKSTHIYMSYLPKGECNVSIFKYEGNLPEIGEILELQFKINYCDLYKHYSIEQIVTLLIRRNGEKTCEVVFKNESFSAEHNNNI